MSEFEKKIAEYKSKIKSSSKIEEIDLLRSEVFGKNGIINLEFKKLVELPLEEKKSFAANINKIKQESSCLAVGRRPPLGRTTRKADAPLDAPQEARVGGGNAHVRLFLSRRGRCGWWSWAENGGSMAVWPPTRARKRQRPEWRGRYLND